MITLRLGVLHSGGSDAFIDLPLSEGIIIEVICQEVLQIEHARYPGLKKSGPRRHQAIAINHLDIIFTHDPFNATQRLNLQITPSGTFDGWVLPVTTVKERGLPRFQLLGGARPYIMENVGRANTNNKFGRLLWNESGGH